MTLVSAGVLGALGMMAVSALGLLWAGGGIGSRSAEEAWRFTVSIRQPAFGEGAAAKDRTASAAAGDPNQPKLDR